MSRFTTTTVAFLHQNPGGYVGGAELTMREFAAAAPDDVEVVWSDGDIPYADKFVIGNWLHGNRPSGIRYLHDMRGGFHPDDTLVFCSPAQKEKYGLEGEVIPPAIDLARFRPNRQQRRHTERKGACSIASWMNPGKGANLLAEAARDLGNIDVYGDGPFKPRNAPNITDCGDLAPEQVAQTLWGYRTFVYLPWAFEPFGRCVVEAWAAGCDIVTNQNVGARYFIEEAPDALENASERFWDHVLEKVAA